jgi:Protein of unknown function DUF262/Protein of unknown function (DUF1524)
LPKLDTDYGSFKDLISVAKVYTVPLYQRRFSWKPTRQVAELWSDVVRLYRERVSNGTIESTHFIGSVVVGETEDRSLGPGACNIIDGQQRMTTLSLLVAAIRDTIVENESDRQDITTDYLTFPKTGNPRLVLSQADAGIYDALIAGETVTDRKTPVFRAYAHLKRELLAGVVEDIDPDEHADDEFEENVESDIPIALDDEPEEPVEIPPAAVAAPWQWTTLLTVLSQDLELVSISGVPAERAYQIFATLNHAGLKLTQVDLIRNAVFMKLPKRNEEAYKKIWQPLEKTLGEKGLGRFLHTWVVRRGHNVPQKDTYASILRELKGAPSEDKIFLLLQGWLEEAPVYQLIAEANSYEASKLINEWHVPSEMVASLRFLSDWGNIPVQPLITEIVFRWKAKRLTGPAATRLLKSIESLFVRRFMAQIPPNDLRSTMARLVLQVVTVADKEFEKAVIAALLEPARRFPTDLETLDALVTRPLYRPKNVGQTFLVLRVLAEALEGKECPQIEFGTAANRYSIEHILPQTVEGTTWFKDLEAWGELDPHLTWNSRRHTAGNLTLTAYNSELSNRSFAEKKTWIAEKLRLQLSTQILEQEVWTKKQIEARSTMLANHASQIWQRPK